ncbi:MAG: helix-hairpin-helix domain-containing protein [Burkholderiales bacterium]|nr:helix-hairpin-helix domain-containing protein [Burkholderiales bacterium]
MFVRRHLLLSAAAVLALAAPAAWAAPDKADPPAKLVDINSASVQQLSTLPGIGKADAERIVAGRPYLTKADLVTAKVLPAGVYLSIKNRIIAKQDPKRPPKAAASKGQP